MSYKPTRRQWVKLWVEEWLTGTTRFELNPEERAIWIDLLALAGRSRFPGIIASGQYGSETYRGYPASWYSGTLICSPESFERTLQLCEKYGKLTLTRTAKDGIEDIVIVITNWEKYQSEYLRQAKYRAGKNTAHRGEVGSYKPSYSVSDDLEGEGEGEGEREGEGEGEGEIIPSRSPPKGENRHRKIDEGYILKKIKEFETQASEEAIREEITAALGHKSAQKWNDQQTYMSRWLGRWIRSYRTSSREMDDGISTRRHTRNNEIEEESGPFAKYGTTGR